MTNIPLFLPSLLPGGTWSGPESTLTRTFNPANGQSLVDIAGPMMAAARSFGQVIDGVELVLLPSPDAGAFYPRAIELAVPKIKG